MQSFTPFRYCSGVSNALPAATRSEFVNATAQAKECQCKEDAASQGSKFLRSHLFSSEHRSDCSDSTLPCRDTMWSQSLDSTPHHHTLHVTRSEAGPPHVLRLRIRAHWRNHGPCCGKFKN
ncbi:hypothetical protein TRVL_02307 [Trypanosoma vivax]|nr:hypothetical protein TRVL_02307 [Trypanosoma vivax]